MPESGNRYFRVIAPAGTLTVAYEAKVSWRPALEEHEAVTELSADRCRWRCSPIFIPAATASPTGWSGSPAAPSATLAPGYARVNGICNWINEYVAYEGGVSDAMTSAADTVLQRAGVCRDFAHLAIALCRTLGIPARYVSAYASQLAPPDFHAVFEAYLDGPTGGGWYLFDPTRKADPAGLIRIGVGRDAAEVAFCSPYGAVEYDKPEVSIAASEPGTATSAAVRSEDGV